MDANHEKKIAQQQWQTWNRDESIIISDVFTWLYRFDKWNKLLEKLQMYDDHLRLINDKGSKGWLRDCL